MAGPHSYERSKLEREVGLAINNSLYKYLIPVLIDFELANEHQILLALGKKFSKKIQYGHWQALG